MPMYEFTCKDCKKVFAVVMSIKDGEKSAVACEHCNCRNVEKKISGFTAVTAKKS